METTLTRSRDNMKTKKANLNHSLNIKTSYKLYSA